MPLGLVCGRKEILALADPSNKSRFVSIGGGTFSENPMTMVAGLTTVRYLRRHADQIYPKLNNRGAALRKRIDEELGQWGVETHTTGLGSLFLTHFGPEPRNAEDTAAEDRQTKVEYGLHLMAKGIFALPAHPCGLSICHTGKDLDQFVRASGTYAHKPIRK
jgi:glutamate-1-semialdehyde 2,1-aminomutase